MRTLIAALLFSVSALAQAQYPQRPVQVIVPWGAGGGADQLARRLGKLLEGDLKVSVPVVNVTGATGNTGMAKLLSAPADGYSMAVFIADTLATLAGGKGRYKLADITPLGVMIRQPSGLFVKQDSKWKTFDDLLADAKKGDIKAAVTGIGSADEMHVVAFNEKHGTKFRAVPFAAAGERYSSILGGHADVLVEQAGDVKSFVDSKQMRPVLFFYGKKVDDFPDVPVSTALGDNITLPQFRMILVKAGTEPARVKLLSDAIARAVQTTDFKNYLKEQYADPNSFVAGDAAQKYMQAWLDEAKRVMSITSAKK